MKTQTANAHMQGVLGYREVLQNHDVLSREEKRTRGQIKKLIRMAKSCSKSPNLQAIKKKEMKEIADTWQKFL